MEIYSQKEKNAFHDINAATQLMAKDALLVLMKKLDELIKGMDKKGATVAEFSKETLIDIASRIQFISISI